MRPLRELAHVRGAQADLPGQRDVGIELRDRHADLGRGRVQLQLRAPHVGTPARQCGRQPDRHRRRQPRQRGRRLEQLVERAGRAAHQIGQAVAQHRELLVVLRKLRADLRQARVGAAHVELAGQPVRGAIAREVEKVLLRLRQFQRQRAQCLRAAILQVGLRDLGLQREQRVVAAGHRRAGFRAGRLHRAPHAPEQVELPGRVEAGLPEIGRRGQRIDRLVRALADRRAATGHRARQRRTRRAQAVDLVVHALVLQDALDAELLALVAGGGAHVRQSLRGGLVQLLACLGDTHHGGLHVEIVARGAIHQLVEQRIVEGAPPARIGIGIHHRAGGDAGRRGGGGRGRARRLQVVPLRRRVRLRRLEVRADRAGRQRETGNYGNRGSHGNRHRWEPRPDKTSCHRQCPPPPPAAFAGVNRKVSGMQAAQNTARIANTSI